MGNKTDFESRIMEYYKQNCEDKGLIFVKSEKRRQNDAGINFYDFTFRYDGKEIFVTFADDDDDIGGRIKQTLRENDIYL